LLASSDSGTTTSDRLTNDDTPTVRVSLNGSGATAPVAGDVVKVYLGVTQVGTATLGAGDISNGYVDITTSTLGADGGKSLTATVTDAAANVSGASSALLLTLDTAAPGSTSITVNGGTLVMTYNETAPGVFSVQLTTTSVGTLILQVNGGAVITDMAGNDLDTTGAIADDTTVTVNDTTAPAAPGLALLAGSDTGQSSTDAVTNDD